MTTYRAALAAAAALLLAGCSGGLDLPDRGHDTTRTEENRLSQVVEDHGRLVDGKATCKVRLLKQDGPVSYGWADCAGAAGGGASVPVRVEGTAVQVPGDGAGYDESVKRLFPKDVADAILDDPDRLRP